MRPLVGVAIEQGKAVALPIVTDISASESPELSADGHSVSRVTVSFTPPSPIGSWRAVELWIAGYQKSSAPVFFYSADTTAITFDLETTGEPITIYFVSVMDNGRRAKVIGSPSTTVLLDGNTSAPNPVSSLTEIQVGDAVSLELISNSEPDMRGYHIARRATAATVQGDILDADIVDAVPHPGANRQMVWNDQPGSANKGYRYYVRAVNMGFYQSAWRPNPPATLTMTAETAPPVTGQSVSESPDIAADGHAVSRISAGFTKPSPLGQWSYEEVYVVGYQGGSTPLLMASGPTSPLHFDLESAGAGTPPVTFFFVTVTFHNLRGAILSSPSASVVLDGQDTAPNAPSNLTAQNLQGNTVVASWEPGGESDLDHYELDLRYDAGGPQPTDNLFVVPAGTDNPSRKDQKTFTLDSNVALLRIYIRAVNGTGLASTWSVPAVVTTLAPDGTTDTGVPINLIAAYTGEFLSPGQYGIAFDGGSSNASYYGLLIGYFFAGGAWPPAASNNWNGLFSVRITVTHYSDSARTADARTDVFNQAINLTDPVLANITKNFYQLSLDGRYVGDVKLEFQNYFGFSTASSVTLDASVDWTGSQAQGLAVSGGQYSPSGTRQIGIHELHAYPPISGPTVIKSKDLHQFDAGIDVTSGGVAGLTSSDIPALAASKITSGTFGTGQIPSLDASKITSGTFDAARIPALAESDITGLVSDLAGKAPNGTYSGTGTASGTDSNGDAVTIPVT